MPAVAAPAKILVTGASSFIGAYVIEDLLKAGYQVVGTVRSSEKGDYIKKHFSSYEGKFDYVIVEDVAKSGAFDDIVKDVDGIEHLASPFHMQADDPQEMITPAVDGTLGVLKSAHAHGKNVKRVIITSSVAAIQTPSSTEGANFTEADWNEESTANIKSKGKDATGGDKYQASKTLAEKAAWDFVKQNSVKFDIATVNPSYVFGPTQHQVKDVQSLNTSIQMFYNFTLGDGGKNAKPEDLAKSEVGWVDVRDVAKVHLEALRQEKAGGERFIASVASFNFQQFIDAISEAGFETVTKGKPGSGADSSRRAAIGDKAQKELGIKFYTLKECAVDTYKSLKERFPEAVEKVHA